MSHSPYIENKVFLVTGGAAGVGAGIVRSLLLEFARCVVFLDVSEREGAALETELLNKFGALRAKFIKCDVADSQQLAAAYKQVLDKYRRLDGVINNAAVLGTDGDFKRMIDINFTGTVDSTLRAMDIMGADKGGAGGVIINISSLSALKLNPLRPVYAATKNAVLQFSNAMAAELYYSKTQVRIITVCLGPTDTAILQRLGLESFTRDVPESLTTSGPERQKVESATSGILDVIKRGQNGSTWMIANDKPVTEITDTVKNGFQILSFEVLK
ncbi:15-hydroxyprostaglandin dehydrogenase [NAD(+)]-like [Galleria mellonella]|uniref:15-hydroxyprostaglandin dehydrogenase [NAD(+)]-like n=1 Tax=Galleria mellonella TaxID=7137 RepID=A0A6J1WR46_GALME|nr:15-hydroxyprostaglandin dehydrogenase [NAD(+)]-like [Galleria mellonella]